MNLVKLQVTKLVHRNPLHFYILTMKDQKEKFKKQFHLQLHLPLLLRPHSIRLRPYSMTSFNLNYISKDPISRDGHIRISTYEFEGDTVQFIFTALPWDSAVLPHSVLANVSKYEASGGLKSTCTFVPNFLHSWACSLYPTVRTCLGLSPGVVERCGEETGPS